MKNKVLRNSIGLALSILISLSLVVVLRMVIFEPRQVRQRSMYPTLWDGDIILVSKLAYLTVTPDRGDVIVFNSPEGEEDLVKRVVAVPGDFVKNDGRKLLVNGLIVSEKKFAETIDYDRNKSMAGRGQKLMDDEFFVIGDNRELSRDSRNFGPIKQENIIGQVLFVVWPLDHFGTLK